MRTSKSTTYLEINFPRSAGPVRSSPRKPLVHRTYIGAVERCEKNVSIDSMEKIALALECSLQVLLGEE